MLLVVNTRKELCSEGMGYLLLYKNFAKPPLSSLDIVLCKGLKNTYYCISILISMNMLFVNLKAVKYC